MVTFYISQIVLHHFLTLSLLASSQGQGRVCQNDCFTISCNQSDRTSHSSWPLTVRGTREQKLQATIGGGRGLGRGMQPAQPCSIELRSGQNGCVNSLQVEAEPPSPSLNVHEDKSQPVSAVSYSEGLDYPLKHTPPVLRPLSLSKDETSPFYDRKHELQIRQHHRSQELLQPLLRRPPDRPGQQYVCASVCRWIRWWFRIFVRWWFRIFVRWWFRLFVR